MVTCVDKVLQKNTNIKFCDHKSQTFNLTLNLFYAVKGD